MVKADPQASEQAANPRCASGVRRWLTIAIGACVLVLLTALDVWSIRAIPSASIDVQIKFPVGIPQRSEPLIATGYLSSGTYLFVTYVSANTAVLTYHARNSAVTSQSITFDPNLSYPFRIELPALINVGRKGPTGTGLLRVSSNGQELLTQEVRFDYCSPRRCFFGENPVGGTTAGAVFRGEIRNTAGELMNGHGLFRSVSARVEAWKHNPPLLALLATSLVAALVVACLTRPAHSHFVSSGTRLSRWLRQHCWFIFAASLNILVFVWLLTGGKFRLIYPDAFGAVYDLQAASLLQGRLDLPTDALGGEAFIFEGKHYTYFGLTPALLRLPFVAFNTGIGLMSRSFMVVEYFACLLGAYLVLVYVTRLLRGKDMRPSSLAVLMMMAASGLGSALLFLGSRAYTYHEAILCGVAFAIFSVYFSLRYLEDTRARWWISSLACLTFAIHARPTVGLFALAFIGCVSVARVLANRNRPGLWIGPITVGTLACLSFLSLNGIAYLKFKTFNAAPHHLNVQYTKERLDKIEGRNFHLANISHNLGVYLLNAAFRTGPRFPGFIFDLTRRNAPTSKMDLVEPAVSIVYSMAGLVFLCAVAFASLRTTPAFRRPLMILLVASVPLVAAMLTFIATSHRYTADFCPPLIVGAAFGVAFTDASRRAIRRLLLSFAIVATAFAFVLTVGLALHFQVDLVWGVPEEVRLNYFELRDRTDPWFGIAPQQ